MEISKIEFIPLFLPHSENIMEDLKLTLKQQIIEALNLQGMKSEDIGDDTPLFGEGLGLDSIDSLELMVLLERNYGIKIEDAREGRKVLTSVATMAEYIQQHRTI
jgi:acyl carrier protein